MAMPTATWEEALQEAYAAAPASAVALSCLELIHSSFVTPVRLIRDPGSFQEDLSEEADTDIFGEYLTLESDAPVNPGESVFFQSVMFKVKLPEQQEARVTGLEIVIDNATKILSSKLDQIVSVRSPLRCIYREYLADDLTSVQYVLKNMSIATVTSNVAQVSGIAEFDDLVNRKFPDNIYRPEDFRSLLA